MNSSRSNSDYVLKLRNEVLQGPVELVPVHDLTLGGSPRLSGEVAEYVRTLSEAPGELPPILVHRGTMRVVDGVHRLRAAVLRGRTHIEARFFDGSEDDGHLLAVAVNVAHGMPLSMSERSAAVERILAAHPDWSDRAVAAVAGMSAKKAADIRRRLLGQEHRPTGSRIGRDGRARPVDPAHRREIAGNLLRAHPEASLREIARRAGISPATVSDVRDRMRRGESPVQAKQGRRIRLAPAAEPMGSVLADEPMGLAPAAEPMGSVLADEPMRSTLAAGRGPGAAGGPGRTPTELVGLFESLRRDPSLRLNDRGRAVLRILDACTAFARNREDIAASLPPHCRRAVAELAQGYAHTWLEFAGDLADGGTLRKAGQAA
ncbi:hypothetical protein AB0B01_12115 [Streptomyces sp. NPDC044571]|uniref:ParB/RepB/Spo0J family partition protein n=1 Tax=Streptomyces sp. NPDC044571 TaxID=3155371 RepID=UPI0033D81DC1